MQEVSEKQAPFSGLRAFLWPIYGHELKKLIPMLLIFFLLFFAYNILRTTKDTVVLGPAGAEAIPFIKVWVMLPGAFLMTYIFTRLSNRFTRETVFYLILGIFLSYFMGFVFLLYPLQEGLHAHAFADRLALWLPPGLKGFISMIRYWPLTSFYVMAELWSNIILFLTFWGFANQITHLSQAKRFYGLFGIGANLSGIVAGISSNLLSHHKFTPSLPFGEDDWSQTLGMLALLVLGAAIIAMALFRWMHVKVLTEPLHEPPPDPRRKMSMRKNFAYLFQSPYLLYIAGIVISYNLVINLVEVLWKHQVRELYPNPQDLNSYMSLVMTTTGVLATLIAFFVSGNAIRKFGWTFTAMLTPTVLLFTSIGFFGFYFFKPQLVGISMSLFQTTPLMIAVFFGSVQNVLSRSAKYTVFDATQQMAFLPLPYESRTKGKAAIDGVCSRIGKSGGSLIYQVLLLTFSTITASAPYVAGVLLVSILGWTVATNLLGKRFNALAAPMQDAHAQEPSPSTPKEVVVS